MKKAKEAHPDLILPDIQLPKLDGYQVTRELKKDAALRSIPIIILTSFASPSDKIKAMEAGANGYIEKPINPEEFISQLSFMEESFRSEIH